MTGGTQQKPSQVGATIRVMREQAGLTQKGLAERASLTERTIRNLEYGVGRPRSNTVLLLAEALGLGAEQRQRLLDEAEADHDPDTGKSPRGRHKRMTTMSRMFEPSARVGARKPM